MSYTETHTVAWNAECQPCQVTVGTDHPVDGLVEMFNQRHEACSKEGEK